MFLLSTNFLINLELIKNIGAGATFLSAMAEIDMGLFCQNMLHPPKSVN